MSPLIPSAPEYASDAERVVAEALVDRLPDDAVVLAGQRITAGTHEVEIDLLVLWPGVGVAVIEVKGGLVSVRDGIWHQGDRGGSRRLDRSPVEQAQNAKHRLLEWVLPRLSRSVGRTVHMVALPFTDLPADWDVPDAPRTLVLDRSDLADAAGAITRALTLHAPDTYSPLDAMQADIIVRTLRRTHEAIENHRALAARIEDRGNQLTREQERAISLLRLQDRAQVIGGAGSGKTHLAMIKARRLSREGRRTALLCYSRGLARHFQLLAAQWPEEERPAYVGLFHDLPVRWGAETEEEYDGEVVDYYEELLPRRLAELAAEQEDGELFDAIVVDEAQDFADTWWDGLRRCLRDPESGVLFVFTDERQAVFDREGTAPITLSPFPLDENLRSTATIARAFGPLTASAQAPRLAEGDPVRFVACPTGDAIATADDVVEQLLDEGWEPGDIVLLATGTRHPEQVSRIELSGHEAYWDDFFAEEDVFYGHVLNVKGLERRVVVLAVNGFHSLERAPHLLYVGLSRARSLLVVVGDPDLVAEVGGADVAEAVGAR
ncbi:nuclease-related domain-containing DEAD/DEAH box helicase [Brachybacterium huguangmaarense]